MINNTSYLNKKKDKEIDVCLQNFVTSGANRANSVHQFVRVDNGATTRNGPVAPS